MAVLIGQPFEYTTVDTNVTNTDLVHGLWGIRSVLRILHTNIPFCITRHIDLCAGLLNTFALFVAYYYCPSLKECIYRSTTLN